MAQEEPDGCVREYWVQAESFLHNLVPNGRDDMTGTRYSPEQTTYWAIGLRGYTANWTTPLPANPATGPNTGIPGPILRGRVGDVIRVHFRNNDNHYRFPHSMHAHGVRYDAGSDGSFCGADPDRPGTAVPFGQSHTYTWQCLPDSVGTWTYHDHSAARDPRPGGHEPVAGVGAMLGMFGILAVTDGSTPDVEREFALVFHDLTAVLVPGLAVDFDAFNGFSFLGNTPTFTAVPGDRVRWRIAALGDRFHVFHLPGHRWCDAGRYTDAQGVGPAQAITVDYVEDNPGEWLYHCQSGRHRAGGTVGRYRVTKNR